MNESDEALKLRGLKFEQNTFCGVIRIKPLLVAGRHLHVCCKNENMDKSLTICVNENEEREELENVTGNTEEIKEEYGRVSEKEDFLHKTPTKQPRRCCNELLNDNSLKHKFLHTGCVCLAAMAMGWRMSIIGPSLPDLRLIINENLSKASWIISAVALGGLAGSLCGGAFYDRFNKYVVFAVPIFVSAVATAVTPWCSNFGSMVAMHVLFGAFQAGLDTIIVTDTVQLWRQGSAPFLQAVNFAFSIGAMFSPLAVEPFLAKRHLLLDTDLNVINTSRKDRDGQSIENEENPFSNTTDATVENATSVYGETNVQFAFLISGAICFLAGISFILEYCFLGSVHKIPRKTTSCNDTINKKVQKFPLRRNRRIIFLILLSIILSTYVISERILYSYLMTYLVERLNWDKTAGSTATTVFWTLFMIGRLLSVVVVKVIRLLFVFVIFFGILLLGETLMLISVIFDVPPLTWVSCGLYGLGFSALFGCIISWISENVCPLSGKLSSVVFTITATGAFVFPLITGNVMSAISYDWFIYLEMILTCLMIVLLTGAEILYRILL